jgi:hypothetical protein
MAIRWKRDAWSGVYVAQDAAGDYYSISPEQGGWVVSVRTEAPDLEAYPVKLGRQFSGFTYRTLRDAKAAVPDAI